MQPLVSIIVPVYNMEQYLAETLDSILATTYANYEVVVMDDGSTDGSYAIAQRYAAQDSCVRAFTQPNSGTCDARNNAIRLTQGEFILPVDGDDKISPRFVELAANILIQHPDTKVVCPQGEFFDGRTGAWNLPPFSLGLLARRNVIPATAMYRKDDWERVGGYCKEIIYREDWEFWISILKDGGRVERLSETTFYYRIRPNSKRIRGRKFKQHVTDTLNKRHPEFYLRELGGPLRNQRSWSKVINRLAKCFR